MVVEECEYFFDVRMRREVGEPVGPRLQLLRGVEVVVPCDVVTLPPLLVVAAVVPFLFYFLRPVGTRARYLFVPLFIDRYQSATKLAHQL